MATAQVVNLTGHALHLQAMVLGKLETVTVPPTLHGKSSRIDAHFAVWQELHPDEIKVLYFTDNQGQRVDQLPPEHLLPTTAPKPEPAKSADSPVKPEEKSIGDLTEESEPPKIITPPYTAVAKPEQEIPEASAQEAPEINSTQAIVDHGTV